MISIVGKVHMSTVSTVGKDLYVLMERINIIKFNFLSIYTCKWPKPHKLQFFRLLNWGNNIYLTELLHGGVRKSDI